MGTMAMREERKVVTALFADLVGSTALGERLDPEDVKVVARAVLSHRITIKPDLWMTQASGARVVDSVLGAVPTPGALERRA